MLTTSEFQTYKPAILSLPADRPLTKEDLLTDDFLMKRSGRLAMYYAPHNEFIRPAARVVIVGITPGWTQMKTAFETARAGLLQGLPEGEIVRKAKEAARFSGSMRRNLISMLDELELHRYLGLPSSEELFAQGTGTVLHTTSLLRYPVFVQGKNYTGAQPPLLSNKFLRETAVAFTKEELDRQPRALIIPLGRTVEGLLHLMEEEGFLGQCGILHGFPHPSGANGHRHKQFADHRDAMKRRLEETLGQAR
ncbi:hypothetical protein [Paenibacillus sp. UNC499MF]|uniref:hypothetical protein n=1 Tax=Paenibacillus sp. UNC499MF TaxID=1502751 RepID=UPI00089FA31A|nr:hypothetical protein [Paenibacillus sp. UNC499MF]SEG26394.1 hypothetical protein SAMN02799616_02360 [Paenibacillus sp. UNC499MF]